MDEAILEKIAKQTGMMICPVCGATYIPCRKNQKTCLDPMCRKEYHRKYVCEYNRRRREAMPKVVKEYNRNKMRKYRQKQRELEARKRQLEALGDDWEAQVELSRKIAEYGDRYGEVQAQKILESVPKIDVTMGEKGDDNKTDQDEL